MLSITAKKLKLDFIIVAPKAGKMSMKFIKIPFHGSSSQSNILFLQKQLVPIIDVCHKFLKVNNF